MTRFAFPSRNTRSRAGATERVASYGSIDVVDYDGMRMRRFATALVDFFRRWGAYCAVVIVVFSAGSNAPLTIALAAAAGLVGPLRIAAEHGWAIVPATAAYALAGALPVVCTRQLWWPRHWAEAERALPLAAATLRRSDRRFAVLVMLPWQGALAAGVLGGLVGAGSPIDRGAVTLAAWFVSACGSLHLASLWMRSVRRAAGSHPDRGLRRPAIDRPRGVPAWRVLGATRALLILPLVRGRATRSAAALVLGTFATSACATGPLWPPVPTGWSLALLALTALIVTSWLRACTTRELQPLWQENRQLPLSPRKCELGRTAIVLIPVVVGVLICIACATGAARLVRPNVLAAFAVVLAGACAVEATTTATLEPTHHAARWVLLLAVVVAFGSEVAPS